MHSDAAEISSGKRVGREQNTLDSIQSIVPHPRSGVSMIRLCMIKAALVSQTIAEAGWRICCTICYTRSHPQGKRR